MRRVPQPPRELAPASRSTFRHYFIVFSRHIYRIDASCGGTNERNPVLTHPAVASDPLSN